MQIIQNGSQEKVYLNVYSDGVLTQADSLPTLSIYDADNDSAPLAGYSNVTVVDESEAGIYSFFISSALTQNNRMLELKWNYQTNGLQVNQTDFYSIETVYASTSEIIDFLGLGAQPQDPNFQKISDIVSAEKIARTIVNGYTGQKFWRYYGTQEMFGKGSDALQFTERMLSIDKVWENDILVIDNTVDPYVYTFGFPLEITQTGFAVRIYDQGWDVRYDNQVDPAVLYYGRFQDNARYKFQGDIGYKYVPEDIKIATMLLVNDIISNDFNWRNKYLAKVDLSEISFEMDKGAFLGTGNIVVDNILDQYRHVNIVII